MVPDAGRETFREPDALTVVVAEVVTVSVSYESEPAGALGCALSVTLVGNAAVRGYTVTVAPAKSVERRRPIMPNTTATATAAKINMREPLRRRLGTRGSGASISSSSSTFS